MAEIARSETAEISSPAASRFIATSLSYAAFGRRPDIDRKAVRGYETSDFFFYTRIGATQEIPRSGKLGLRANAASRAAEIAKQQHEETRREVEAKVRENCVELFFLSHRITLRSTAAGRPARNSSCRPASPRS